MNFKFSQAIDFISPYLKRYKKNVFTFYCGLFADNLIVILITTLLGILIDQMLYYRNLEAFLKVGVFIVFLVLSCCILHFFTYAQHQFLYGKFLFDVKIDALRHVLSVDSEALDGLATGGVAKSINIWANACVPFIIRNVIHTINNFLFSVVLIVYSFTFDIKVGVLLIIMAPVSVFLSVKISKYIASFEDERAKVDKKFTAWFFEMISHASRLRTMGAFVKTEVQFERDVTAVANAEAKTYLLTAVSEACINMVRLIAQLIIFIFAAVSIGRGNMTIGTMVLILSIYDKLVIYIQSLNNHMNQLPERLVNIKMIKEIFDLSKEKWTGNEKIQINHGNIEFKNISFSYKSEVPIFDGINLNIKEGERVAIIGPSGAGKSTLIYMLLGFYIPQKGEITIDGEDVKKKSLKSVRQSIGLVSQRPTVFDGTIRENLTFGSKNKCDEEIIEACRKSCIWSYIESLPNGLDTEISPKTLEMSGGQLQRLSIARIYIKNPKIIIFDEATSALDSETENQILKLWESVLQDKTAIIISHKKESIRLCNRAVAINDGHIVADGPTNYIVDNHGFVKALFD